MTDIYYSDYVPGDLCTMLGLPQGRDQVTLADEPATKPGHYVVKMFDGNLYEAPRWTLTLLLCKHCRRGSGAHAV